MQKILKNVCSSHWQMNGEIFMKTQLKEQFRVHGNIVYVEIKNNKTMFIVNIFEDNK